MGGRNKYTAEQEEILRRLEVAHEEKMTTKRELRQRIEDEFKKRMDVLDYVESRLMNQAKVTMGPDSRGNLRGISESDIARRVKVGDWRTLKDMFALAADDFVQEIQNRGPQWEFIPGGSEGLIRLNWIQLPGGEFTTEPWVAALEWRDDLKPPMWTIDFALSEGDTYDAIYNQIRSDDRELWNKLNAAVAEYKRDN